MLNELPKTKKVLVCGHVLRREEELRTITCDEDGDLHFLCDLQHSWEDADNDSMNAEDADLFPVEIGYLLVEFKKIDPLLSIPVGHVAYYFETHGEWGVEPLLGDQNS